MRIKYFKSISLFFITIILAFTSFSCDFKNPIEGVNVLINMKDISTSVGVKIVDAKTGQLIQGVPVSISFGGTTGDHNQLANMLGETITSTNTSYGITNFAVKETRQPSTSNPVKFVMIVKADGYLKTSMPITISQNGTSSQVIKMVKLSDPPEGVKVTLVSNAGTTNSSGVLQSTIALTAEESSSKTKTSVTINPQTIIRDASGQPLVGTLKATVVNFTNQTERSLDAFPGGLFVNSSQSGQVGLFTSGGFAAIEITDAAGREATTLTQPVNVGMQIPPNTFNPKTNALVKNGDVVPIWSYDLTRGQWTKETEGTVSGPDANGNFSVNFQASHLSYWNIDWEEFLSCPLGSIIKLIGKFNRVKLLIKRVAPANANNVLILSKEVSINDPFVQLWNAPQNVPLLLEAWGLDCGVTGKLASMILNNPCLQGIVEFPIPDNVIPNAGQRTNINVQVTLYCESDRGKENKVGVKPNIDIWIYDNCNGWGLAGRMVNGQITLQNLVLGQPYKFGVYYALPGEDQKFYEQTLVFTNPNNVLEEYIPAQHCGTLNP